MTRADVKNKMKTLSQGQYSDGVLDKMAATFRALVEQADFTATVRETIDDESDGEGVADNGSQSDSSTGDHGGVALGIKGLVYNINIHLPESRDPAVYDALFRSLRQHLTR